MPNIVEFTGEQGPDDTPTPISIDMDKVLFVGPYSKRRLKTLIMLPGDTEVLVEEEYATVVRIWKGDMR